MNIQLLLFRCFCCCWLCAWAVTCQQPEAPLPPLQAHLHLAAPPSLAAPAKELVASFARLTASTHELTVEETDQLMAQIRVGGMAFDVVMAADLNHLQALYYVGLTSSPPLTCGMAQLVLWTNCLEPLPRDSALRAAIDTLQERPLALLDEKGMVHFTVLELLHPSIDTIGLPQPGESPYGDAAIQALYCYGLFDRLSSRLRYSGDLEATTTLIQEGGVAAGFTAKSMVLTSGYRGQGYWATVDPESYVPMPQGLAVLQGAENRALAQQFVRFVLGAQGRAIMAKYGF